MITEDYVSFETAKLLKENGFDEPCALTEFDCDAYKKWVETAPRPIMLNAESEKPFRYSVPSIYVAIKWLRKEKGFHIFAQMEIDYDEDERGNKWYHNAAYYPEIIRVSDGKIMYDDGSLYAEPEQAYEVAIKYCLENLI